MHHIWAIIELTSAIARLLEQPDLARLARVCRDLWEAAVPLIWKELNDISVFRPLLKIAGDKWGGFDCPTDKLTAQPHYEGLSNNRLALHAKFVRRLKCVLDMTRYPVLKALLNAPSFNGSLVNLKSLEIILYPLDDTCDGVALFRTFYTPILTHLRITVNSISDQNRTEPLRGLIQAVTTWDLPALQNLGLLWRISTRVDPSPIEQVLRTHQQLRVVEIAMPECSQEIIETVKQLPALQTLKLNYWDGPDEPFLPTSPTMMRGFPRLISLDIRSNLSPIRHLLTLIESDQMRVFKMSASHVNTALDHRMDSMLECLTRFKGLKEVELHLGINIIWEDIEPVLACRGITRFSLISNLAHWIPVERTHLDAMVQAWPDLSCLELTNSYYPSSLGGPLIELADLLHITNIRPSIRTLRISFDAHRYGQEDVVALVPSPTESISPSRLE
ncbi:hypothetical protein FRC01_011236, partial [Tulasnella sp. 417]